MNKLLILILSLNLLLGCSPGVDSSDFGCSIPTGETVDCESDSAKNWDNQEYFNIPKVILIKIEQPIVKYKQETMGCSTKSKPFVDCSNPIALNWNK